MFFSKFPKVVDESKVGTYEVITNSGGGYFYDQVLEYRVWYKKNGKQYCYSSPSYEDAFIFYTKTSDADRPIALVLQEEYISELKPGLYEYIKSTRQTEWFTKWLSKDKLRTQKNLARFNKKHHTNFRLDEKE